MKSALLAVMSVVCAVGAQAQQRGIDTEKSALTIHVSKSGAFSAFGHTHEVRAPIAGGTAETGANPSVEMHVDARALRVMDTDISEKDRGEIQKTMLGPEVLDSERFPEIVFKSTAAVPAGEGRWTLRGTLTLHGQARPVAVDVVFKGGHYTGHATLKQTDFGIKPVRVAGGAMKVKDELQIEFDMSLRP